MAKSFKKEKIKDRKISEIRQEEALNSKKTESDNDNSSDADCSEYKDKEYNGTFSNSFSEEKTI